MRFPKKVNIAGKTYSVTLDRKRWGSRCRTGTQEIHVGVGGTQSAERKISNYVHEVMEATTMEREFRYASAGDEIMFVMTHKQFTNFAEDVSTALMPMLNR